MRNTKTFKMATLKQQTKKQSNKRISKQTDKLTYTKIGVIRGSSHPQDQTNLLNSFAQLLSVTMYLSMRTPLITPVMSISWTGRFWEVDFDMLEEHVVWEFGWSPFKFRTIWTGLPRLICLRLLGDVSKASFVMISKD